MDLDPNGGCDFKAKGDTKQEVIDAMMAHAGVHHKEKMDNMTDEEKMMMGKKMDEVLDAQM
ncbi:MAG: DUF1059 domain-containing protein [Patescibacteria group bacterium]